MHNVHIVGQHDQATIDQAHRVAERAVRVAVLADGHRGYWMPIGGVAAFRDWVSPVGIGFDISCGNCAIQTDITLDDLGKSDDKRNWMLGKIADDIQSHISFGIGRSNLADDAPVDHPLFEDPRWDEALPSAANVDGLKKKARDQLGTVGSGNHYVDVFTDEDGYIWVGCHFGSRGFGHTVCSGFMSLGAGMRWNPYEGQKINENQSGGMLLHLKTDIGQSYWAMMELAGQYAYAGREWVVRKIVRDILHANEVDMVHNHHNYAFKERHWMFDTNQEEEVVVIRKGATPAFPGQRGFVGGSMGDISVILEGAGHITAQDVSSVEPVPNISTGQRQQDMLYSTVHGAGRVMGRAMAKGKKDKKTGDWKREPLVYREDMDAWVKKAGIFLRGGDVDEAPQVYRRLPDVLKEQGDTINVLHTLTPIVVVMAGSDARDPYKD